MRIIQRVGYYLVGVAIGLVLLAVFVKGKKGEGGFWDDFAYLPEARVLKSLGNMPFTLSAKAEQHPLDQDIDSTFLANFYQSAAVDFSNSNTRESDCLKEYSLTGSAATQDIHMLLTLNPCDSLVQIQEITVVD